MTEILELSKAETEHVINSWEARAKLKKNRIRFDIMIVPWLLKYLVIDSEVEKDKAINTIIGAIISVDSYYEELAKFEEEVISRYETEMFEEGFELINGSYINVVTELLDFINIELKVLHIYLESLPIEFSRTWLNTLSNSRLDLIQCMYSQVKKTK